MDTNDRSLRMRLASYRSWGNTADRSARTAPARRAADARFLDQARELHPGASEAQLEQAAEMLRKAHFTELARRSAASRRIRSAENAKERQRRIEQQLAAAPREDDAAAA